MEHGRKGQGNPEREGILIEWNCVPLYEEKAGGEEHQALRNLARLLMEITIGSKG